MMNQPPRGRQQQPLTPEFIARVAAAVQQGSSVALYPSQNDLIAYQDNADATHPVNIYFPIPSNFQTLLSMRLSLKILPFRTYNTITGTNTGGTSNGHVHGTGGESGHSHSHSHTFQVVNQAPAGASVFYDGVHLNAQQAGGGDSTSTNAAGSSGHNHGNTGGQSADHTHPLNLTQVLGITEAAAPVNPGITISIDGGPDISGQLAPAGPYNADQVELDIRAAFGPNPTRGVLHVISMQPNQNCRLNGILKLSYQVAPGIP